MKLIKGLMLVGLAVASTAVMAKPPVNKPPAKPKSTESVLKIIASSIPPVIVYTPPAPVSP